MSFDTLSEERLDSFKGKLITFLVDGRATNRLLARCLVLNAVRRRHPCTILDVDALYSSNSDFIFGSLADDEAGLVELLIPLPGSDLQSETARVLSMDQSRTLIVDSLNSMFHLLTAQGRSPKSRNLAFILAFLSYLCHSEGRTVMITKYRRAVEGRVSISDRSDFVALVTLKGDVLSIEEEKAFTRSYPV